MSLFGAMNSGVSGLAAQSSAMAAIADNITNVNTVGYKSTKVAFQTMVTKQAVSTQYSSGGVQSRPRAGVDIQGLLQSSTSATDLAISGDGFFLVNESPTPGTSDQFLYTRAASFSMDELGFLKNTAGFFLQGWPTDGDGNVILPSDSSAGLTNQNIISPEFLETVNLNRVGGTADETSRIGIGANLPSTGSVGDRHEIDVQFFDTLGTTNAVAFAFTKEGTNEWSLHVEPPRNTSSLTLYDSAGGVYNSTGQIEFTAQPAAGSSVAINGTTYTFGGGVGQVAIGSSLAQTVSNLVAAVQAGDAEFAAGAGNHAVGVKASSLTTLVFSAGTVGANDIAVNVAALDDASGDPVTRQGLLASQGLTVHRRTVPLTTHAIQFNSDGLPNAVSVAEMAVAGFVNGAGDMDGGTTDRIALNFGSIDKTDGMTQFSDEFEPGFIEQNGARFGVFTGITISSSGLMSALFDNGEERPIYRIPIVTFTNPDGLQARTGNVWNATDASGNPTLRTADTGPAGQIQQSSLEASTVDIGEEFTTMIVAQRAYSAAARIISTSDEMLEELVRIKR